MADVQKRRFLNFIKEEKPYQSMKSLILIITPYIILCKTLMKKLLKDLKTLSINEIHVSNFHSSYYFNYIESSPEIGS